MISVILAAVEVQPILRRQDDACKAQSRSGFAAPRFKPLLRFPASCRGSLIFFPLLPSSLRLQASSLTMFWPRLASFTLLSTLVGNTVAVFSILAPGGENVWWGEYLSTYSHPSPSHNYITKLRTPRTLLCGLATIILLLQLTSSCTCYFFFFFFFSH